MYGLFEDVRVISPAKNITGSKGRKTVNGELYILQSRPMVLELPQNLPSGAEESHEDLSG
jgi:hypothetical protein